MKAIKTILYVENDPVSLTMYQNRLQREGFHVETAQDGLLALRTLSQMTPDLVVLDLMLPRFSGAEVFKIMRTDRRLKNVPVVIFSNAAMTEWPQNLSPGTTQCLPKSESTFPMLLQCIQELLVAPPPVEEPVLRAEPVPPIAPPNNSGFVASRLENPIMSAAPAKVPTPAPVPSLEDEIGNGRIGFLKGALGEIPRLRELCLAYIKAPSSETSRQHLAMLHKRMQFFSTYAIENGCARVHLLTNAFSSLLSEIMAKPSWATTSVLQTMAQAMDCLRLLLNSDESNSEEPAIRARVLAVDDDPVCNHVIVTTLKRANIDATTIENPEKALELLQTNRYDLVLLDVNIPRVNGFEVCVKLRRFPHCKTVPVIFVTAFNNFDNRKQSVLSGGNDFITKPISPLELALKVTIHMLKGQVQRAGAPPAETEPEAVNPAKTGLSLAAIRSEPAPTAAPENKFPSLLVTPTPFPVESLPQTNVNQPAPSAPHSLARSYEVPPPPASSSEPENMAPPSVFPSAPQWAPADSKIYENPNVENPTAESSPAGAETEDELSRVASDQGSTIEKFERESQASAARIETSSESHPAGAETVGAPEPADARPEQFSASAAAEDGIPRAHADTADIGQQEMAPGDAMAPGAETRTEDAETVDASSASSPGSEAFSTGYAPEDIFHRAPVPPPAFEEAAPEETGFSPAFSPASHPPMEPADSVDVPDVPESKPQSAAEYDALPDVFQRKPSGTPLQFEEASADDRTAERSPMTPPPSNEAETENAPEAASPSRPFLSDDENVFHRAPASPSPHFESADDRAPAHAFPSATEAEPAEAASAPEASAAAEQFSTHHEDLFRRAPESAPHSGGEGRAPVSPVSTPHEAAAEAPEIVQPSQDALPPAGQFAAPDAPEELFQRAPESAPQFERVEAADSEPYIIFPPGQSHQAEIVDVREVASAPSGLPPIHRAPEDVFQRAPAGSAPAEKIENEKRIPAFSAPPESGSSPAEPVRSPVVPDAAPESASARQPSEKVQPALSMWPSAPKTEAKNTGGKETPRPQDARAATEPQPSRHTSEDVFQRAPSIPLQAPEKTAQKNQAPSTFEPHKEKAETASPSPIPFSTPSTPRSSFAAVAAEEKIQEPPANPMPSKNVATTKNEEPLYGIPSAAPAGEAANTDVRDMAPPPKVSSPVFVSEDMRELSDMAQDIHQESAKAPPIVLVNESQPADAFVADSAVETPPVVESELTTVDSPANTPVASAPSETVLPPELPAETQESRSAAREPIPASELMPMTESRSGEPETIAPSDSGAPADQEGSSGVAEDRFQPATSNEVDPAQRARSSEVQDPVPALVSSVSGEARVDEAEMNAESDPYSTAALVDRAFQPEAPAQEFNIIETQNRAISKVPEPPATFDRSALSAANYPTATPAETTSSPDSVATFPESPATASESPASTGFVEPPAEPEMASRESISAPSDFTATLPEFTGTPRADDSLPAEAAKETFAPITPVQADPVESLSAKNEASPGELRPVTESATTDPLALEPSSPPSPARPPAGADLRDIAMAAGHQSLAAPAVADVPKTTAGSGQKVETEPMDPYERIVLELARVIFAGERLTDVKLRLVRIALEHHTVQEVLNGSAGKTR